MRVFVMETGVYAEGGTMEGIARSVDELRKLPSYREFLQEHIADDGGVYYLKFTEWDLETQEQTHIETTWWSWRETPWK